MSMLLIIVTIGVLCSYVNTAKVENDLEDRGSSFRVAFATLQDQCKNETRQCQIDAFLGKCWGRDDDSIWTICPCSCKTAINYRMKQCCNAVNDGEKPECLQYCHHDMNTPEALFESTAFLCVDKYHFLMYCMSEGHDVRDCCKKKGIEDECLPFCVGDHNPFTCGDADLGLLAQCSPNSKTIQTCFISKLSNVAPSWRYQWRPDKCTNRK